MGSITKSVSGASVTIGTKKIYAAPHQFGAVIKPVNAKALAFRLGGLYGPHQANVKNAGTFLVLARSVRIPARPYLGFGPRDQREVIEVLDGAIKRLFGA